MHTANTLAYFKNSFISKKIYIILEFEEKMCFSMDFVKKKIISCIFEFYNMFVKSKGYWPIFKKI